jgi:hypothetical protein
MVMSESSLSGIKHNVFKYGTPLLAAVAVISCGGSSEQSDPNALVACPQGYEAGQQPLGNPETAMEDLVAEAKHYHIRIKDPSDDICGVEKTQKFYISPAGAVVRGLIKEAENKRAKGGHKNKQQ